MWRLLLILPAVTAYPPPSDLASDERPQPDWALVHRELRRRHVSLILLWEEYCDSNSDSFSYSWFCERYNEWAGRLKPTLRRVHLAGEKLFVDYSGHTLKVVDGLTGGCGACRSSSPCSAPRTTTPAPRPASAKACRTGQEGHCGRTIDRPASLALKEWSTPGVPGASRVEAHQWVRFNPTVRRRVDGRDVVSDEGGVLLRR